MHLIRCLRTLRTLCARPKGSDLGRGTCPNFCRALLLVHCVCIKLDSQGAGRIEIQTAFNGRCLRPCFLEIFFLYLNLQRKLHSYKVLCHERIFHLLLYKYTQIAITDMLTNSVFTSGLTYYRVALSSSQSGSKSSL